MIKITEALAYALRDHLTELRCEYVALRDGVAGYEAREAQYTRLIEELDDDLATLDQCIASQ